MNINVPKTGAVSVPCPMQPHKLQIGGRREGNRVPMDQSDSITRRNADVMPAAWDKEGALLSTELNLCIHAPSERATRAFTTLRNAVRNPKVTAEAAIAMSAARRTNIPKQTPAFVVYGSKKPKIFTKNNNKWKVSSDPS